MGIKNLFKVYREQAGTDGVDGGGAVDGLATSSVEPDTSTDAAVEDTSASQNSDTGSTVDDTGADTTSEADGTVTDTGEGSQTPPDAYADFALPEGMTLDSGLLETAKPLFKELGLTQDQAQKLVDFQAEQVKAGSQRQVDTFNQLMKDWQDQSRNDKEFGGDKFDENISIARTAVEKLGTPELKQLLESHGVGNHPEMIRFMVKVGNLVSEDVPGNSSVSDGKPKDRVSMLYPNDRNG